MDKQRFMISDAAASVNVESHVLRYWEEELELAVPRNEMGHRYYTKDNIEEFLKIKELKEQGYQLKAIKMILHNENPVEERMPIEQDNMQMGGMNMEQKETAMMYTGGQRYMAKPQPANVNVSGYQGATKLDQFQEMMTQIVKEAIAENNHALGREVGEQVGDRVLKEMNYLMREQDEQEEARYRKLDEAIRSLHKKKEKRGKVFGKKQVAVPKQA